MQSTHKVSSSIVVVSGRSNRPLAERIAHHIGLPLGDCDIRTFSDGELWVKYGVNIRGCDVFIIQSTNPPGDNLMELLIMIDAAKRASAKRVTAVIPYFGYARQDRKDQPRVAITAKLVANLITSAGADRVIAMDLHAPQIQGFFDIPFDHLYASAVLMKHLKRMNIPNLAVVSPDVGGIKIARAYAKRLNADLVVLDKRRPEANKSEVLNVIGSVEGKNVLLVDDLIDTAGTFVNAISALKQQGAEKIYGACTHAVFSGEAPGRIENCEAEQIIIADTIQLTERVSSIRKVSVKSVSQLFAEAIKRTFLYQSISSLFDVDKDKLP